MYLIESVKLFLVVRYLEQVYHEMHSKFFVAHESAKKVLVSLYVVEEICSTWLVKYMLLKKSAVHGWSNICC